ncbi:MAG: hypothetical protein BalsKO_17880 [Balneolaceae bacterium]
MSILFLLSGLGVINGFLVAIYLFFRAKRTISDIYFAGLLFALSIRIGKSVYYYFGVETNFLILQIGLSACTFIGPFFYLYVRSLRNQEENVRKRDLYTLFVLLITITCIGILFPYPTFPEIWNGYIVYGIYIVWGVYALAGFYQSFILLEGTSFSLKKLTSDQQYFSIIVLAMFFITATYMLALSVGFTYIWSALIFTVTFYFLLARVLFSKKEVIPKSPNVPIENAASLLKKVNEEMILRKLYLNKDLKLNELAQEVGLSRNVLSRILNEEYKYGFSRFIKNYRVEEAKELIRSRPELSIEGIGYEAGFKSKSAFFEAFKNLTGSHTCRIQELQVGFE